MDFLDIETLAALGGARNEHNSENLEHQADQILKDLEKDDLTPVTRDLLVKKVTKINQLIKTIENE